MCRCWKMKCSSIWEQCSEPVFAEEVIVEIVGPAVVEPSVVVVVVEPAGQSKDRDQNNLQHNLRPHQHHHHHHHHHKIAKVSNCQTGRTVGRQRFFCSVWSECWVVLEWKSAQLLHIDKVGQSLDKHGKPLSPLANIWDKHGRLVCSLVGWLQRLQSSWGGKQENRKQRVTQGRVSWTL